MTASREPATAPRGAFYQSVLAPHPATPCAAVRSVEVRLVRAPGGRLDLTYTVKGALRAVRMPNPAPPRRADELWRHTCFEAFVAPEPGAAYVELNLSPSGEWASYAFTRYREGMTPEADMPAPEITVSLDTPVPAGPEHCWTLGAAARIRTLGGGAPARVALAAVIEELDGTLCYWALRHPPGRPDFHHPDGFALRI
jgi:hypothetical protein